MEKIYLIGDLHGNYKPVRDFVDRNPNVENEKNIMICLGDFGGNYFFDYRDTFYKSKLGKYPFTYFVIRGNHEERPSLCRKSNPSAWHTEKFFGNIVYVENEFPYIKYAADIPTTYLIGRYNAFIIPGAYSVDKYRRLTFGWSWFENEQLTPQEMKIGREIVKNNKGEFDLILSHTCPIMFEPTDLFLSCVDQSTVEKDMERYLGELEYNIDYKAWLWGHYHAFRDYPRTDGKKRIMLSAGDEAVELEQIMNNDMVERM